MVVELPSFKPNFWMVNSETSRSFSTKSSPLKSLIRLYPPRINSTSKKNFEVKDFNVSV